LVGRVFVIGIALVTFGTTNIAAAATVTESEPNNSRATANLTLGTDTLTIDGTLNPSTDQDFFSFSVTRLGVPSPGFSTAVRFLVSSTSSYTFAVIDPLGNTIVSGNFNEPRTIDFNPAAIGGIGTYTIEMAGNSPSSSGRYEISIFGVSDGGGQPPVIAGSAGGTPAAVPTLSTVGILGLLVLVAALTALLRRFGISQN